MVKLLIKKQLREIFRSWFVNQKTNQRRSKAGVIGFLLLFVVMMNQDIQRFIFGNW